MWTSSVFYWSGNATTDCVAYCFSSVAGYSKIGAYTGNGSTNGPIVNTGFEPAFIMIKNVSAIYEWTIYDNKRSPSNPRDNVLYPNNNDAENTGETGDIDFLTNGFPSHDPPKLAQHSHLKQMPCKEYFLRFGLYCLP